MESTFIDENRHNYKLNNKIAISKLVLVNTHDPYQNAIQCVGRSQKANFSNWLIRKDFSLAKYSLVIRYHK